MRPKSKNVELQLMRPMLSIKLKIVIILTLTVRDTLIILKIWFRERQPWMAEF